MEGKPHSLGYAARRRVDFPRQGLNTVLLEEAWMEAPAMGSVASPGTGGLAGAPLSLSKKSWVGCRLGEAGDEACCGRQVTARPVIAQGNSH